MMKQFDQFCQYYENDMIQMIELPFIDNLASFYVIMLKDKTKSINSLAKQISSSKIQKYRQELSYVYTNELWLPKFKLQFANSLKNELQDLGLSFLFDCSKLSLSEMSSSDNICISDIMQNTFIEVEERGIEAAAITEIQMLGSMLPPQITKSFYVDHPFLYLLQLNSVKENLFFGKIMNPQQN